MKRLLTLIGVLCVAPDLSAQSSIKFPPDSLVNMKVIPRSTSVIQVIGQMRNFTGMLGVRCQFCHVGTEGRPLTEFNFVTDEKRTKVVARQMMQMVAEINRRLDSLPMRGKNSIQVTCNTCHRGVSRPASLASVVADFAEAGGLDSAVRAYKRFRTEYYGRAAYDFGEGSLNSAAFGLGRAGLYLQAFGLLDLNEQYFPTSSTLALFRGNISLIKGDTVEAAKAFREAIRRDPNNDEAKGRLQSIGQKVP